MAGCIPGRNVLANVAWRDYITAWFTETSMQKCSPITTICFDLFNTLVSVGKVPLEIGGYTADILGVDAEEWNAACFSEHHDICAPSDHYQNLLKLAHIIDPAIPPERIRLAAEARQRRFDYALLNIDQDTLEELVMLRQQQLKLVLISNASSPEVQAWPGSPLAVLFDKSIFSCDCGSRKPELQIYQHACQQLGVSAEECLFVGDGGSDEHYGALQAGMSPVLMTRYLKAHHLQQKREELKDVVTGEVGSIKEILNLL